MGPLNDRFCHVRRDIYDGTLQSNEWIRKEVKSVEQVPKYVNALPEV